MNKIYLYKIDSEENIEKLPSSIRKHCSTYTNKKKKKESVFAWTRLVEAFKEDFNYDLKDIIFNEHGKPYLKDQKYFISLSHSKDVCALMISDKECGVDVQEEFMNLTVSDKLLNDEEKEEYEDVIRAKEYVNEKWVKKEAYGKKLGVGLTEEVFNTRVENDNILSFPLGKSIYYLSWSCEGTVGIRNNLM